MSDRCELILTCPKSLEGLLLEEATNLGLEETRERASDKVEERVNELFLKLSGIDRRKLEEMNDKLDKLAAAVEALSRNK